MNYCYIIYVNIPTQIMLRVYFEMNFEIIFASSFKSQASNFQVQALSFNCARENLFTALQII